MHHRSQEGLDLKEGELYVGFDRPNANFDHDVWNAVKEKYGNRVFLVHGDRANMVDVPNASVDELVALGSHAQESRVLIEFNRVLKPGGILRLGTTQYFLSEMLNFWGVRLERLGYVRLSNEELSYKHRPMGGTNKLLYFVVSFRKKDL